MSTEEDSIRYVVVGIGINANTLDFPEEIRATATSPGPGAGESGPPRGTDQWRDVCL